ncbi:MAG: aldehyde dehydrogenase family protein [Bacillota bacterium]|nr:aldehyde dehydrogenase family protein [Bacillota bacterium]
MTNTNMNNSAIDTMISNARVAQKECELFNQQQVDRLVMELAKVVFDNAVELAQMAVEETQMGLVEDKIKKNQGKAKIIWNSLKGKKSVGIISRNEETGIVEIAKPVGVVAAVIPTTNPIVTAMSNAMFAIKGRNAVIIAPHPRAKKCTNKTIELIKKAIAKLGAPDNLIQIIEEPTIELTGELMKKADVIVATGGMGMVKAAYSSGKPSFGVGAGNVQCIIDRGVDLKDAVAKIITGRIFDNGIICAGEQTVIAPKDEYEEVMKEFINQGAYYTEDENESNALRNIIFANGLMNKDIVGLPAIGIAKLAGIEVPEETKLILMKANGPGKRDLLSKEKMCPVMATYAYNEFTEAIEIAQINLELEGKGHTTAVHSNNDKHIEMAGENLAVCRLVVNQTSATTAGGSFYNGFAPTNTLGCGSWGNNSISENFTYKHLLNITRIGYFMKDASVPTDEDLWEV